MRPMLKLILLCSLVQFAIAQAGNNIPEGCGTIYKCFIPTNCLTAGQDISVSTVMELVANTAIVDDCDALIKFHQYQAHWAYVSIESFKANDEISKITFLHKDDSDTAMKSEFSCELSNNVLEAKYKGTTKFTSKEVSQKIKCDYELTLPISQNVFDNHAGDDYVRIQTDGKLGPQSTLKTRQLTLERIRCDASNFKFVDEPGDSDNVYTNVVYKAGKYYCDEANIYELDFLPPLGGQYGKIDEITCDATTFHLGSTTITKDKHDWIYVRCKADAQYFCNYPPTTRAQLADRMRALDLDPPTVNPPKKGSLKCPDGYPHLFIGRFPPLTNPTIECRNYGGTKYWTVNDNIKLTPDGPEAYCSKSIACDIRNEILGKSVTGGFVNDVHLPDCHDQGTLTVGGKQVTVRCDESTGQFKYAPKDGGAEQTVAPDTQFLCTYPKEDKTEENQQNQQKLMTGVIAVAVSAIFILAVVPGLGYLIVNRHLNKLREQKKREKKEEKFDPVPMSWNKLMMNIQYVKQKAMNVQLAAPGTEKPHLVLPDMKEQEKYDFTSFDTNVEPLYRASSSPALARQRKIAMAGYKEHKKEEAAALIDRKQEYEKKMAERKKEEKEKPKDEKDKPKDEKEKPKDEKDKPKDDKDKPKEGKDKPKDEKKEAEKKKSE